MENPKFAEQLRQSIDQNMLIQAFGSVKQASHYIGMAQGIIRDPNGILLMHGSFVNGKCENPKSPYFMMRPDQERRSDLDLNLIDCYLFRDLPYGERCWNNIFPIEARGDITQSLMYPDGHIKDFLKRRGTTYFSLYTWLQTLKTTTSRIIDFRVYKNWEAWYCQKKNYWLLADKQTSYIGEIE